MMKKVINGIVYNTETAKKLAENWNGCDTSNFNFVNEELYLTKKNRYFLYGEGGAASKYREMIDNNWAGYGETIIPLSDVEVIEVLESWNEVDLLERLFPDHLEEA